MPSNVVKSFSEKTGKSVKTVEKMWHEIKDSLIASGHKESDSNFYPLLVSILEKKLGIAKASEIVKVTLSNFSKLKQE